jgi:hypothetical protein
MFGGEYWHVFNVVYLMETVFKIILAQPCDVEKTTVMYERVTVCGR